MARWLCRLDPAELSQGEALVDEARRRGIGGWLLAVTLDGKGQLSPALPLADLLQGQTQNLSFCLTCHLSEPLTPRGEEQAAAALAPFLAHPQAVRLAGRPLLVLQEPERLSHPQYSPQRLRLALQCGVRTAGGTADPPLLLHPSQTTAPASVPGFDGAVETLAEPTGPTEPITYERCLHQAHYRPLPPELWIPAVRTPKAEEESGHPGADADRYREWLELASAWSELWHDGRREAPVLLENWPAHRHWWDQGTAEAPSPPPPALAPAPSTAPEPEVDERSWGEPHPSHLALLIHGFYLDRLESMLRPLAAGGASDGLPALDLYLSTPEPQLEEAAELLRLLGWPRVRIFGVANRGRDIAPFLRHLLPAALDCGHGAFVKLHTKASPHLELGEGWGGHLVESLLARELLSQLGDRLSRDPELGLLAPSGTLLPTTVALNRNAAHLLPLLRQGNLSGRWFLGQRFVAGSMMAGRLEALRSLLKIPFPLKAFAPEAGQTDGTLAHALERWICAVVLAEGWTLEELPGPATAVPGFGYRWVTDD
ncbi:rhamnan synthesis F family protein [Synechococcus sp. CS-1328]|uniref:rhamnan synthesis F family protein n=1 Tax=Synechococcus sp. CS-1328 TaxID=2847976 RepID=UPI00223BF4AA|nr:rhamnan synthesis F family protein [Synechococcus sp. CS-1328]MCT0225748.1 rhamnan synthesis F family protein [Synechococcus sp. CS-1328]